MADNPQAENTAPAAQSSGPQLSGAQQSGAQQSVGQQGNMPAPSQVVLPPNRMMVKPCTVEYDYANTPWDQIPISCIPCPHKHFKTETIDRSMLEKEDHIALLATPKGYRWLGATELAQAQPYTIARSGQKRTLSSGKLMAQTEQRYIQEFLSEVWGLMSTDMVNKLKNTLVNEFGMTAKEAEKFISKQSKEVGPSKRTITTINNLDLKSHWLKQFRRLTAAKLTDYIVSLMCARRSKRTRMISAEILRHLCDLTGQECTLNNPKNKVQRLQVFLADRLAAWLAQAVAEADKELCEELKTPKEKETDGSQKKERRKRQSKKEPKKKESEGRMKAESKEESKTEKSESVRETKAASKPSSKLESKKASKKSSESEIKKESKPPSKQESKRESKKSSESEIKKESKPPSKHESKGESKKSSKSESKKESNKSSKSESKKESTKSSKSESKKESKKSSKSESKKDSKKSSKSDSKEVSKPSSEPESKTESKGSSKLDVKKEEAKQEEKEEEAKQEESKEEVAKQEEKGEEDIEEGANEEEAKVEEDREEDEKATEGEELEVIEIVEAPGEEEEAKEEAVEETLADTIAEVVVETEPGKTSREAALSSVIAEEAPQGDEEAIAKVSAWMDQLVTEAEQDVTPLPPPPSKDVTFHIRKGDSGCYYDVKRVDQKAVCDQTYLGRSERAPPLAPREICERPPNLASVGQGDTKKWAVWAASAVGFAERWVDWIEKTCKEAESMATSRVKGDRRWRSDWRMWKREKETAALELKRNAKMLKTHSIWGAKLEQGESSEQ